MTIKSNSATCDDCGDMGDVQREEHLDRSVCEVCYEDYCAERFCYECESWNSYIINAVDQKGFPVSHDEILDGVDWQAPDGVRRVCVECNNEWTYC